MNSYVNNGSMITNGPVARWLDTFACIQYADLFKKFGYDTLNDVCKLETNVLSKIGVAQMDIEKIIENVSVLRQTLQAGSNNINSLNNSMYLNQKVNNNISSYKPNYISISHDHQSIDNTSVNSNCTIETSLPNNNTKPSRRSKASKVTEKQKKNIPSLTISQVVPNNMSNNTNDSNCTQTKSTNNKKNKKNAKNNNSDNKDNTNNNFININFNNKNSNTLVDYNNNYNLNNIDSNLDTKSLAITQQNDQKYCNSNFTQVNYANVNLSSNPNSQDYYKSQQHLNFQQTRQIQQNFNQQQSLLNKQHTQQPSVLLSPISNPPSLSSSNNNYMNGQQTLVQNLYNNNNNNQFYGNNINNSWQQQNNNAFNNTSYQQHSQQQIKNCSIQLNNNCINSNHVDLSNQNASILGKNTPLDYLERLALLPECQVVDPKSIVNEENNNLSNDNTQNNTNQPINFDLNNNNNLNIKRINDFNNNSNNDNIISHQAKKICTNNSCSSNSNSPLSCNININNNTNNYNNNRNKLIQTPQLVQNDSPSSSCSSTSLSSNSTSSFSIIPSSVNSNNDLMISNHNATSILDASNFDFLDYLPELNSNTIDQTINSNLLNKNSSNITSDPLNSICLDINNHNKFSQHQIQQFNILNDEINQNNLQNQHQYY